MPVRSTAVAVRSRLSDLADPALAAVVCALLVAQYLSDGTITGRQKAGGVAAALVIGALVAVRRRRPLALVTAVPVFIALRPHLPQGGQGDAWGIAAIVAGYTVAVHGRSRIAWLGLAASLTTGLLVMAHDGTSWNLDGFLFYGVFFTAPWLAGRAIRARRMREGLLEERNARLVRDRVEEAQRAVWEERERIARELHDVVGHALGVIVLQAGGAGRLIASEPDEAARALATIERVGRNALGEMRRLVEILRASDAQLALLPQPGLARLGELVDEVRDAGLPVALEAEGVPPSLPPGVDLTAYRIIQEALTNALKHAGPASARVVVRYGRGEVELEISDDGPGVDGVGGGGHGLAGIRERASIYGGRVDAGPLSEGGYAVRARLPYPVEP